jgi:hypothetical protein
MQLSTKTIKGNRRRRRKIWRYRRKINIKLRGKRIGRTKS